MTRQDLTLKMRAVNARQGIIALVVRQVTMQLFVPLEPTVRLDLVHRPNVLQAPTKIRKEQ